MKIPEVREEIAKISLAMRNLARRLDMLELELHRHSGPRAPAGSQPMTPELKEKIVMLYRKNRWPQYRIARELDINQGRVSEVIRGKRK